MIYIYDILLNFIDGKRMYEFFEWNSEDDDTQILSFLSGNLVEDEDEDD